MEGEIDFKVPDIDKLCKTWYKVVGDLESTQRPLVLLHGGPGATHEYLIPHEYLASKHSIPIVFYDQLGNGKSTHLPEKNGHGDFWTERLFIDQLVQLLEHLGIQDNFDLLGHSWGGMLAARFAISRPKGLKRLILADSLASMELWKEGLVALRAALPRHVQDVLDKHEASGTTDSPEYQKALQVFYYRHLCRQDPMPAEILSVFQAFEDDPTVYGTMFGPSELQITGSLKTWTVVDSLHNINVPTLVLNGRYDEAQDIAVEPFFRLIPKVRWYTFAESSHFPQGEENEKYMQMVGDFLLR